MSLNFKDSFSPVIGTLAAITWSPIISLSYKYCDSIPIDFISEAQNCGSYSEMDILLPGLKQGVYVFFAAGVLGKLGEYLQNEKGIVPAILIPTTITFGATYGVQEYFIQSQNSMQPTLMGTCAAFFGYGILTQKEKAKEWFKKRLESRLNL